MKKETFILRIFRGTIEKQYWEEFELPVVPSSNVISSLMEIQRNPKNRKGETVTPVVWEMGCLEEVCGSCSMLINGYPRQACTALIEPYLKKSSTITLAPFTKFPLVKDLVVDRSSMFESLKKVHAWIDVEDLHDTGFAPKVDPKKQKLLHTLSTCMTCGCCLEGCPQVNNRSKFIGPAAVSQARLFNENPLGKWHKEKRLRPLMEEGGITDCGNAQNCKEVCPKKIPLTESIAKIGKEVTKQAYQDFFGLPDTEKNV